MTADALYDAMATPEALGAFVSRAYENAENKNAFKQAMDQVMAFINRFVAEVKALAKKIAGKNPEARAMLEHEADWGESIIQEYNRLMEEAGKREAQQQGNGQAQKENVQTRYSTKAQDQLTEDKYFQRAIDAWDGTSSGGRVKIGVISKGGIYEGIGLPDGVLYMDYSKLAKALSKHGDHLSKNTLKQIPQMLASPVVITQPINPQVKNTVNVFGDLMGDNGKPIMVSIMMRPDRTGTFLIDVIRTVEMRSDAQKLIIDQSVLYLSENKKRTTDWFQGLGNSSVPFAGTKSGFIRSIAYESENSNSQGGNSLNGVDTNEKAEPTPANRGSQKGINPAPISSATNSIPQVEENSNTNKNFSLKNVDTDMTEMQRVVEENERLQKLVGSLNAQLRAMRDGANGKAAVDRKAVWALAREMKAQYQSKVRVNDLGANLQKAFDAMANARTDTEGKSAMEAMAAIARDMLDKSENIDSTMYDEYAEMRGYLRKGRFRLTDAQWAEAAKLYGSEKEFRKAAFGRWNIAARNDRNALSLDAAWEEMHQQWPGMFDQDASEGDKVQQVMAALEAVRREVSNPYAMNLEEMTQYVTAEMYQTIPGGAHGKGRGGEDAGNRAGAGENADRAAGSTAGAGAVAGRDCGGAAGTAGRLAMETGADGPSAGRGTGSAAGGW